MNNKKNILRFQIISAIFIAILGTLLHFAYDWSNQNLIIGVFSAVNESTWEHLKLLFFPVLITIVIGYFYIGKYFPNFICSKTIGIITSILSTIILFYTYSGILGFNIDIINIIIFFINVILSEYISYRLIISNYKCNNKISSIILIVLSLCFILFTYFTPQIGLFQDPITNNYGIIQ